MINRQICLYNVAKKLETPGHVMLSDKWWPISTLDDFSLHIQAHQHSHST